MRANEFSPRSGWGAVESRQEREINEAQAVQQALLPADRLIGPSVEISSLFRPVNEVGGDFLDHFSLPNGRLCCMIGDVVGKGLPAALYAALVTGIFRGLNKTGEDPNAVLERLNSRLLERSVPERFCMMQYAIYDPERRLLSFANAGLYPPLHLSAEGCQELGEGWFPCGLLPHPGYPVQTVSLSPGDAVLFATDGLMEAQNSRGAMFQIERLKEVCVQNRHEDADAFLRNIFVAVDTFANGHPQHDDMTACLLKCQV